MNDRIKSLPALHDAYLRQLEEALPNVKGNGSLVSLFDFGEKSNPELQSLMDGLESFLLNCEAFEQTQYRPCRMNSQRDYQDVWLPMLVLGSGWRSCVKRLLGLNLPEKLEKCGAIHLRPESEKSVASFTVFMRDCMENISESEYVLFEEYIKDAHEIRSEYDISNGTLRIIGTQKILSSCDQNSLIIDGELPKWLDVLISMEGVARIEIRYPIMQDLKKTLSNIISSLLVIPVWPIPSVNMEFIDFVTNHLKIGTSSVFFTILSGNNPEFYPLINSIIERWTKLPRALEVKGVKTDLLMRSLLKRHFVALSSMAIRQGQSYNGLDCIFVKKDSGGIMDESFICKLDEIDDYIFSNIGSLGYFNEISIAFEQLCTELVNQLDSKINTQESSTWVKNIAIAGSVFIHQGKNEEILLREYLRHVGKSLRSARDHYSAFNTEHYAIIKRVWKFIDCMNNSDSQSEDFTIVVRFLLGVILNEGTSSKTTAIALSGMLYLLNTEDIIAEVLYDDSYALLYTIKSLSANSIDIPTDVNNWRKKYSAIIDKFIDNQTKIKIKAKCDSYCFDTLNF